MAKSIKSMGLAFAAVCAAASLPACAAGGPDKSGYWTDSSGNIARSGAGLCWRSGSWTPELGLAECGDLPPAPKQAPVIVFENARPARAPEAAAPRPIRHAALNETVLFNFNSAALTPAGKRTLDEMLERVRSSGSRVSLAMITGHTDPIGSESFNLDLSRRRARVVASYLIANGFDPQVVEQRALGESSPIPGVAESCEGLRGKSLKACYAPLRRSEVEVRFNDYDPRIGN